VKPGLPSGVVGGFLALILLVGCSRTPPPSARQVVAFDDVGLRITLPEGWEALRSTDPLSAEGASLFYLSNQSLEPDCVDADGSCRLPLSELREGGMLVWWSTSSCAGVACELPDGERRLIAGREAASAPDTGACQLVHATEEEVYAVTVTPQRVDWIVLCARRPGTAERSALALILDEVEWRTP
jgi:hypothetical protein